MPVPGQSGHHDPLASFQSAILHRYRLERELGRGGMATVYLAHDLKHGRLVALKVLRAEIAALLGHDRFLREIQFAARLNHPNILPLYDSDQAAGMLFYVMPYVEGGTLRDRLAGGPRPTLTESLGLIRQIAAGLDHAHALEVVHRDIKPANILLASGHPFIADFGIARMVRQAATEDQLTGTGLVLGTPSYMAPEQRVHASKVDGRSDEYSLACVLYEMLLGAPPDPDLAEPDWVVRNIRAARKDIPPPVEAALARALATEVSERFASMGEFAAALDATTPVPYARPRPPVLLRARRSARWVGLGLALALAAALVRALLPRKHADRAGAVVVADTSRYAILPMEYQEGISPRPDDQFLLHDALTRWSGLSVVDHFQVRDALDRHGSSPLTVRDATTMAREMGAGRYVRGEVSRTGDSLRVHAILYDVPSGGTQLGDATIKLPSGLTGADSLFAILADRLLFRGAAPEHGGVLRGTRSLPARQAFARGQLAIQTWDLAGADSAFTIAALDPRYAEAQLWLGLVRAWGGSDPARWRYAAEQAAAGRDGLASRDQAVAEALLAQARGDLEHACARWVRLTATAPSDFVGWFGAAYCQGSDDVVIRDARSPSGYRFRSSYQAALLAYQRAFELLPSILVTFRGGAYEPIRRLLRTSRDHLRSGRSAPPDTATFRAYPAWQGDSLVFIPYPSDRIRRLEGGGPSVDLAVRHQRELFHRIALTWTAAAPQSPYALEALAVSLELLGDRTALRTIEDARHAARDPEDAHRIAATEVRMRLKFSLPDDTAGIRSAKALADSLLGLHQPADAPEADALLGLAVLTGRANLAGALSRRAGRIEHWSIPGPLEESAPALLTFAALGGPVDSLLDLEGRVRAAIDQYRPASEQLSLRLEWIARPATLAFPTHRFRELSSLAGAGDYLVDAQVAFARGESASVRRTLTRVADARRQTAPADLALDALYPEAWLLAAIGNDPAAAAWLDPTLNSLASAAPRVSADPSPTGALIQAMALRAELAERRGAVAEARRWAIPVALLWKDADVALQPLVRRMARIGADHARSE